MTTFHTTSNPDEIFRAWEDDPLAMMFTTSNATLNQRGQLVMGAGHAKQVKTRFPGIDKTFGFMIQVAHFCRNRHRNARKTKRGLVYDDYGVLVHPSKRFGLFQVKQGWWQNGKNPDDKHDMMQVIRLSSVYLGDFIQATNWIVHMPFPGIGNGGLKDDDVFDLIYPFPDDRVHIWRLS